MTTTDAEKAAAAIEAAVEWTMKQIQSRDEAPRSWDAGFPSIKASALLCLLPTFDPDRWLAIRDERIRLEARLDETKWWHEKLRQVGDVYDIEAEHFRATCAGKERIAELEAALEELK